MILVVSWVAILLYVCVVTGCSLVTVAWGLVVFIGGWAFRMFQRNQSRSVRTLSVSNETKHMRTKSKFLAPTFHDVFHNAEVKSLPDMFHDMFVH